MNKYKFAVPCKGGQLEALLLALRQLPTNTNITNSTEETIHQAVRNNPMEEMVYIFFNPNARWSDEVLEYCFNRNYFVNDTDTADYEWEEVQSFISANSGVVIESVLPIAPGDKFKNAIFHVNGEYESRAVLLRLKETGKITEDEYLECFPSGDENRYLAHKTIFLTNGVVTFDTRKLSHRMNTELPEPTIIDMDEFLSECRTRPHARLMREWLDDTTMQIEVQSGNGSWEVVRHPWWMQDSKYRRYVAKTPVEMKVEGIMSGLSEDERAELKRQLAVL